MTARDDQRREEQALDALIVLAFLPDQGRPPPDLAGPEPSLSREDRQALDALGPDLAERITRRTRGSRAGRVRKTPGKGRRRRPRLTGSLHRGQEEGELTDAARAEMERKIRELNAEDQKESEP